MRMKMYECEYQKKDAIIKIIFPTVYKFLYDCDEYVKLMQQR